MNVDQYRAFLFQILPRYNGNELRMITKSFLYASSLHEGQFRKSGEPYIVHPIEVARILYSWNCDAETLCAGLLHDVIEDCNVSEEELAAQFHPKIAYLVNYVSKWAGRDYPKKERDTLNLNLLFNGITTEVRVCIIKLADRLHNMRTLDYMKPEKQIEISEETLKIFVPLANMIGLHQVKRELERLCFHYLYPKDERILNEKRNQLMTKYQLEFDDTQEKIRRILNHSGIKVDLSYRIKEADRIHKRIVHGSKFSDIPDILLFHTIVDNDVDCKKVSQILRNQFSVETGFIIKNYIDRGKNNLYQGIRQTIPSINNISTQVSIQTKKMQALAKYGVAYYWEDPEISMNDTFQHKILAPHLMRKMASGMTPKEYVESVVKEIFCSDKIYVNTPKGKVIELPRGATVCDFAYRIHSTFLYQLIGAKVNDEFVNLNRILNNGDTVELFQNNLMEKPNNLVNYCKTNSAAKALQKRLEKYYFD